MNGWKWNLRVDSETLSKLFLKEARSFEYDIEIL